MDKEVRNGLVIIAAFIVAISLLSGFIFWNIGSNAGFDRGTREAGTRETERIELIEEYEQRESDRNRRERERIERTETAIITLESLGAGTRTELQKLREIHNILADFYNNSRNDYLYRDYNHSDIGE